MVNGVEQEENKTPVMHLKMLDTLIKEQDTANLLFRGAAKTSVFGEYMFPSHDTSGKFTFKPISFINRDSPLFIFGVVVISFTIWHYHLSHFLELIVVGQQPHLDKCDIH